MSEETKLTKFETIITEIQEWFNLNDSRRIAFTMKRLDDFPEKNFTFNLSHMVPCRPSFLDGYNSNPYVALLQKIVGSSFPSDNVTTDMDKIIKVYKDAQKDDRANPRAASAGISAQSRNQMIFWMLFLAALDDEIYNNELDSIIDIAYCMDFNEAMIRDWCRAVEYIMQGNRLQEGCDFPCETIEGARFFLHRTANDSSILSYFRYCNKRS